MFKIIWKFVFGGCINFFLKNLRLKIFFLQKSKSKIFENSIFAIFFLSNCTFQHQISIWNYFSFHLMYIMSVLVKNYRFSKIFVLKAENFMPSYKITLASHFGNIMNHRMVFKDFIEGKRSKMSLKPLMVNLGDNLGR